jgi:quercetin dioxygenase-like cupin family protein
MLTRRGFGGCAVCAALGFVAAPAGAQEQEVGRPVTMGGVTRTILKRADHDEKHVILLVMAEIDANAPVARHTHPGIESVYIVEGGFEEFAVQGQPSMAPKAGDGFTVAANTPHGGRNGPRPTKIVVTYVVEKGKPLASPA